MRLLICDDEKVVCHYLKNLIIEYCSRFNRKIEVFIYNSSEELLFETCNSFPFDLILLDIQMKEMNGIDLAKKIREIDKDIPIVFVTGISDYVFEGYEVGAYRYLLKPISEEKLFAILDNFYVKPEEDNFLVVSLKGETLKLNHKDILYIEAMGHYINIKLQDKEYTIKESINNYFKQINDSKFIFCHRSYIVNILAIETIKKEEIKLTNGTKLPLSRNYYKTINEEFIKYYQGVTRLWFIHYLLPNYFV